MARSGRWGWHELDQVWATRLVTNAGIKPGDLVLDIGAGTGSLVSPLLETGARVIAIELHPGRVAELRRRFESNSRVTVVQADAADLRPPRRPFKVVANPPFAITSPLLKRLLGPRSRLVSADLIVQQQVARRWTGPGAPGRGRWARTHTITSPHGVPRSAFRPRPTVNTRLLRISRW